MNLNFATKRRKSFWRGLVRTAPFIAAGILSLVLFYWQLEGEPKSIWDRGLSIGLIFFFLCVTVFFAVSQQLPYSKKNIIEDLLDATLYQLGGNYRINIMILVTGESHAHFKIEHARGYRDISQYKKKVDMDTPGVSTAWKSDETIYLSYDQLCVNIDKELKQLWSVAIKGRRGQSVAVLNIDDIINENASEDTQKHISVASQQLAQLIGYYWEIPS